MGTFTQALGRATLGAVAAGATTAAVSGIKRSKRADALERINHQGNPVSLAEGPGVTIGATSAAIAGATNPQYATAAACSGFVSGAVGLYDDLADTKGESAKGLKGHLGALRKGRLSAGTVKILGISAAGVASAALVDANNAPQPRRRRLLSTVVGGGVIAGAANLINLFDLRPGRALKVATVSSTLLASKPGKAAPYSAGAGVNTAIAVESAAATALPDDLQGKTMLGDCGANSVGALLGLSYVARTGLVGRSLALAVIGGAYLGQ
ncbi:hypothetical protein [Haloglycomyces albus]|uniref:hypothetical protein n=1 Tax=Haloglycomyces albus TaxID=526067 RepID=UPI0004B893E2|nr:hypothetical protein [Haloglycomyces albus]